MPQVATREFERLPLRVHTFLAGVPLHDVWSSDLPRWRGEVTLAEFVRMASSRNLDACSCSKSSSLFTLSPIVRMLLDLRLVIGRFFGWHHEPANTATFATRLTDTDRSKSLLAPGAQVGLFRIIYRFENEHLLEFINRTASRGSVERSGRDSDWLPVLLRHLCPQRKPLHAVLHGTGRSFSETDRLSVPFA